MNNWEKELEDLILSTANHKADKYINNLTEFIRQLLHSHNEKLIQRIKWMKVRKWEIDPPSGIGYNRALNDIVQLIQNSDDSQN